MSAHPPSQLSARTMSLYRNTKIPAIDFRLVLPNDVESVDLQTEDPFDEATCANWTVHNRHQTIEEAYDLLGQYANRLGTEQVS